MRLENSFQFLPRVGAATEQKLWNNGVTTWDDFVGNDVVGAATRERGEQMLEKARRNLDVGNSLFFAHHHPNGEVWRLYQDFADAACFFDIETTGLDRQNSVVTTVSFHLDGETTTLVRGKDLSADRVRDVLDDARILVSFNGKRFDVPFLEAALGLEFETPHIDLMYLCKRLGLTGGLKQVEHDLGVDRELEDIDGREAIRLWKQYEQGDDEALETLVQYNRLDVINLEPVMKEVHERLRADVFEPHLPN